MSSYLDDVPDYSVFAIPASSRPSALKHLRAHQSEPNPLIQTLDPLTVEKHHRSASMAEIQPQAAMNGNGADYAGEKRRNKLGYHRTAMACSHCRRRKIRCLMQPGDQQKRCINCIKLKRECHFQPVENQNGDRRSRANSKSDFTSDISPGSSPVQGHSMSNLDAQLDGYSNTSMIPGFDTNPAAYTDGLSRSATWHGGEYMDHPDLATADPLPIDHYSATYGGASMPLEADGLAAVPRRQSSNWASHTSSLPPFHGGSNGLAYTGGQSGVEDLVSLPGSAHTITQSWPSAYPPQPDMYGSAHLFHPAAYSEAARQHYEAPQVQSAYHSR